MSTEIMLPRLAIPIPVAPEDRHLPFSCLRILLPIGQIAEMNLPMQGAKTWDNAIKTLELWKDTLVVQQDFEI